VDLRSLSDSQFHREMESAARAHQSATIAILHCINELHRRKSFLDLGYSSVFDYCRRKLQYSSSTAGRLIQAARCIRRHPDVLEILEKRELSVSTICLIEPILDEKNKRSVLERVRGASRRDVKRIVCDYRPPLAFRDRITPVRVASASGAENMVLVQYLASEAFGILFNEVRDLRSGSGEERFGATCEAVFREYHERHSPLARQHRRGTRNGSARLDSHQWEGNDIERTRHIPDEVRDAVFVRDHGQCTFAAPDGTRCLCTKGVQVDHIVPFAAGGTHDPSNLRLLCGAHNRRAAERALGLHVMQPYWRAP
jgi:5-methylcytosine-specific restriction endonuclease McrA